MSFDPAAAARHLFEAHAARRPYANLADALAPPTIADAYRVQEALVPLWTPMRGNIAGRKIATTTKVMQQLMGIDHPCGGLIYSECLHRTGATLRAANFMHLVVECELAVRLGADLPAKASPYTRADVRAAIAGVMPAFELIEDRNADYKTCKAESLIADNAWNGGIVLGHEKALDPALELDGLTGTLNINGKAAQAGKTDDPLGALAWVANLAVERKSPMTAGMIVITGSVIPTLPISVNDRFSFTLDKLGTVEMTAV